MAGLVRTLEALVELTRAEHGLMVALAVAVGAFSSRSGFRTPHLLLAALAGFLVEAGAFALNDYFNVEEDSINKPHRPIVRGDIPREVAALIGLLALASAAGLGAYLAASGLSEASLLLLLTIALCLAYDVGAKRLFVVGHLLVALLTALPFVYGSYVARGPSPLTFSFFSIALLSALGRELIKGAQDVEGDRKAGVRSVAVVCGPRRAVEAACILSAASVALSPLPLLYSRLKLAYLAAILPADCLIAYAALAALKGVGRGELERAREVSLAGMGVGIVAFLLASL